MTSASDLRVRAGEGLLARRGSTLLFLPAPDEEIASDLLRIFISAENPSREIGDALVDRALQGPSLALIEWDEAIALMVFGDLEVSTDQPSLPMLSGASSASWVEHSLPGVSDRSVTVTVSPPDESVTNLMEGIVPAGGFSLEIGSADARSTSTAPIDEERAESLHFAYPPPTPKTRPTPVEEAPLAQVDLTAIVDPADSVAALAAIQAAAGGASSTAEDVSPVGEPLLREPEPQRSISPDVGELEETLPPTADVGRRVPAKICADGHASPQDAAVCWTCDSLLSPTAAIVHVPEPRVGQLRFEDGYVVPVERAFTIGRSRSQDGDRPHVHIDGDNVSRVHVAIAVREWAVYVTDMGSTNGTILAVQDGPELLEPNCETKLEFGSTVHLGSRSFQFEKPGQNVPHLAGKFD